jgi:hypothetical protein
VRRVPLEDLVEPERLARLGPAPSPRELRALLPRGWVLDDDGRGAHRDRRLAFREGWVLVLGLVAFGAAAAGLFWWSFPRGSAGLLRFALVVLVVLVAGGVVAPLVTRALRGKG